MTAKKNPGQGVPKESARRNSLNALQELLPRGLEDAGFAKGLVRNGYYKAGLMEQRRMVIEDLCGRCRTKKDRAALRRALLRHASDTVRSYVAGLILAWEKDDITRSCAGLYEVGTGPGTWCQESAQMYLKQLMQHHSVAAVLEVCASWVDDERPEARRLLIEALRPRGVWTGHLIELRDDPAVLGPLLEALLDDPSKYVQDACANCLNDISKDNPALVCTWVRRWTKRTQSPARAYILRRGMRSLVKAGDADALKIMGYGAVEGLEVKWTRPIPKQMRIGDTIDVEATVINSEDTPIRVRVQVVLEGPGLSSKPRVSTYLVGDSAVAPRTSEKVRKKIPFRNKNSQPKLGGKYTLTLFTNGQAQGMKTFAYELD